ncbi:unnamed protein product [Euphydryas editha]|uniref:FLYWCH-type domain-containing protein n=1 Tax=Euphydryas editha TaxID=104508 RepID=A0AAU9TI04_EUPED|nr:unnamed protein product [Euphydryas editha]
MIWKDFEIINLPGKRTLLMFNGYTFAQTTKRHWYCSKRFKGCQARVFLSVDELNIVYCDVYHNHDPPVYRKAPDGCYLKIKS